MAEVEQKVKDSLGVKGEPRLGSELRRMSRTITALDPDPVQRRLRPGSAGWNAVLQPSGKPGGRRGVLPLAMRWTPRGSGI